MIPPLYEHQKRIISEDKNKCGLFMGTGSAKTRTALEMAEGSTLIICPKQQRDDKTWENNAKKFDIILNMKVISKEDMRRDWEELPQFDTVIIDECFVAGTRIQMIGGYKMIEDIVVGDVVKNAIGFYPVTDVMPKRKNTVNVLYKVNLSNGTYLQCTGNHPFYTLNRGWVRAENLNNSDLLMSKDMLYLVYGQKETKKKFLCDLWEADSSWIPSWRDVWTIQEDMQSGLLEDKKYTGNGNKNERVDCFKRENCKRFFRKNEEEQSYEESKNEKKSLGHFEKNWISSDNSWWKWTRNANSTKNFIIGTWKRLVWRIRNSNKNKEKQWLSNVLQGRYWQPIENGSHRGRWGKSFFDIETETGQEENEIIEQIRVASVEIQEQTNTPVYNFSVAGHPSYFANGILVHNCHTVLGVTAETRQRDKKQIPKASQIFEAVLNYLIKYPPKRLYLCSATPVGKPMNLWAIAKLLGVHWDYFGFRQKYYVEVRMGQRRIWIAKKDDFTKDEMARLIKLFGYVGSLNDFFDVPEQTHKVVEIELSSEQEMALKKLATEEADPLVRRSRARTVENGLLYGKKVESKGRVDTMVSETTIYKSYKIDYILERAIEFPKLLIFANYTAQINEITKTLRAEGYTVSILTGKTKDRTFIRKVDESPQPHIIVAQSAISAGYELPSFPCVIYASKSWQFVHYEQSLGRVLRSNHLKKNLYIHLVVKGTDSDCHEAILSGADFQERLQLDTDSDIQV